MVPAPRLTACPGVGPLLLRWADAVIVAEAESPLLLSAPAPMTRGWRASWAGRLDEAEQFLRRSAAGMPMRWKRQVAYVPDKLDLASRSQAAAWYHARRG